MSKVFPIGGPEFSSRIFDGFRVSATTLAGVGVLLVIAVGSFCQTTFAQSKCECWKNSKTGKAVNSYPFGSEPDPTDPNRAFRSSTGDNFFRVVPCPPPADTGTTPQPKPTPTPKEKKDACDIEFGYDYMRAPGERVKSLHGFGGSLFCNVKPWIGIGGDFSALFGSTIDTVGTTRFDVSLHRQTYLFGPQFNFNANDKVKVFVHPLFGGVHDTSGTTIGTTSVSSSASAFAMEFGGGVDVRLNDHIAVRPIAFDYIPTHFGGAWQSNYRFSTGIVFRLGGH